jgi:hypothetical protein
MEYEQKVEIANTRVHRFVGTSMVIALTLPILASNVITSAANTK